MKRLFIYLICLSFTCCNNKESNSLELEIITGKILAKQNHSIKNIIRYKLTNNSDETYYFNQFAQSRILGKNYDTYLPLTNSCLVIQNSKNDSLKISCGTTCYTEEYLSFLKDRLKRTRALGYTKNADVICYSKNFIIHPKETIFFEELVYLPDNENCYFDMMEEDCKGSIFMFSDSTKYRNVISKSMLQTLEKNKYKVFNGVIKSKNKIQVELLK